MHTQYQSPMFTRRKLYLGFCSSNPTKEKKIDIQTSREFSVPGYIIQKKRLSFKLIYFYIGGLDKCMQYDNHQWWVPLSTDSYFFSCHVFSREDAISLLLANQLHGFMPLRVSIDNDSWYQGQIATKYENLLHWLLQATSFSGKRSRLNSHFRCSSYWGCRKANLKSS